MSSWRSSRCRCGRSKEKVDRTNQQVRLPDSHQHHYFHFVAFELAQSCGGGPAISILSWITIPSAIQVSQVSEPKCVELNFWFCDRLDTQADGNLLCKLHDSRQRCKYWASQTQELHLEDIWVTQEKEDERPNHGAIWQTTKTGPTEIRVNW